MASLAIDKSLYCRSCIKRLLQHSSTRTFTTSPARRKHGGLPTFTPTSSPALDALLSTFRTNVFLPAHLLSLQKSLLYRARNHRLLTNPEEPATVKLGNEVHQLHPLNHITDEPNTRRSIAEALALMREPRDWLNVIPFLEGLRQSGRKVRGWQAEKMARRMGERGAQGVLMEVLRRVDGTGVRLGDLKVCREVMWGGVGRCVQSAWSEEGVREAERWMETWWGMLDEDRHVNKEARKSGRDPKLSPDVVGLLLWVRAVRRLLFGEGKDEGGKVKAAAEMVMAVWGNRDVSVDEADWNDANYKLMMWAPVWHAMVMARKVLGDDTPLGRSMETAITQELEPTLKKASSIVEQHVSGETDRRGRVLYNELSKLVI
ncbi:MAG: hypothetical protein LQ344_005603 [Seirophora lacunosa]|nr:MAG: hypothetical protein LQ344_005603 [Seirophora lacunosa]